MTKKPEEKEEQPETTGSDPWPCHVEALEVTFRWFERQKLSNTLLLQLKKSHDLTVTKHMSSLYKTIIFYSRNV